MLTIFAVPKPFRGHIGMIQQNALRSWLALRPIPEIVLLGQEEGVARAAHEFGLVHVSDIACNELGTPLLDDAFRKARAASSGDVLCYINADILLLSEFPEAIRRVHASKPRFLLVGRRWDIDITKELNTGDPSWELKLRRLVETAGTPRSPEWIDFFAFPRGLFDDLPPFALGRAAFDNWLLWKATSLGATLVDASSAVLVVHQNHDYSHHPQGQIGVWEGDEAKRNRELMGSWDRCLFLTDATHRLTRIGVLPNLSPRRLRRRLARAGLPHRWRSTRMRLLIATYPIRRRLGLRRRALGRLLRAAAISRRRDEL